MNKKRETYKIVLRNVQWNLFPDEMADAIIGVMTPLGKDAQGKYRSYNKSLWLNLARFLPDEVSAPVFFLKMNDKERRNILEGVLTKSKDSKEYKILCEMGGFPTEIDLPDDVPEEQIDEWLKKTYVPQCVSYRIEYKMTQETMSNLFDMLVENVTVGENTPTQIKKLQKVGFSKTDLLCIGYSREDIEDSYDESEDE